MVQIQKLSVTEGPISSGAAAAAAAGSGQRTGSDVINVCR